jgi:Ca2+-transporting ATPase
LVEAGIEARLNLRTLRKEYPLEAIEHRALNRNRMATIHKRGEQHRFIAVKGEPHEVLGRCETILKDGRAEPMTDEDRAAIRAENERMAGEMLRVLGFGFREIGLAESNTDSALTWCGLIGMQDKLRDGAKALIARLHEAGIHTMMITGDQSPTAYAIAQSLGLAGNGNPIQMLDSRHLDEMSQEELNALAPKMHVFSRVDPSDKLKIIRALQENGQVVAMTGDGINDGPALKAADIGIAIGGMELAPKVADMVVLDDDIEPILIALEEGRVISDDIRKSIHYVLATNFSEILTTVLSLVLGLGTPLSAIQLLWMNLLSDIFPELALAAEPAGADVLNRAPRDPGRRIIDRRNLRRLSADSALMTAGALASYGFGLAQYGRGPHAKTLTFLSLTTAQLLYTQSARSQRHSIFDGLRLARSKEEALPPNRYIGMAIGFGLVVEALAIATGAIRNLLGITPLIALDYLAFGAGSLAPFLIKEASKMSPHTLPASQTAKAKQKVAPEKNSRRYCFGD